MKIAQVSPNWYPLPPEKYGGVERVVYNITEGLVKNGHDVDLFASRDSKSSANLIPTVYESPRDVWGKKKNDYIFTFSRLLDMQDRYDVIHLHAGIDIVPLAFAKFCRRPVIVTFHNAAEIYRPYYEYYLNTPSISISDSFRKLFPPKMNFVSTVYNGIMVDNFHLSDGSGDYLAFLGTLSHEKGIVDALDIADKLNKQLKIAAKNPPGNEVFYSEKIEPRLSDKNVYQGEANEQEKDKLLGGARVFLMPINWEEPFGLVAVEAMACGTPVVAYNRGAMPEIVTDGVTGYVVPAGDLNAAIEAVEKIYDMPAEEYDQMRKACRKRVEDHFSMEVMVSGYEQVYKKMLSTNPSKHPWWKFAWQ